MSSSSGASRPWSAPASPRWTATSSSTGSEPLICGVDGLVDEVRRASFNASPLSWRPLEGPLEGPPAKRLRPITLPDQREPPPLVAPALLALSSAAGISPLPLPAVAAALEASDAHEQLRHAPHPPPPPPTPLGTPGRRDYSQDSSRGLDWRGWRASEVRRAERVRTLPEPEWPLPSRMAAKRHKVCESRSPASSTGDCGE